MSAAIGVAAVSLAATTFRSSITENGGPAGPGSGGAGAGSGGLGLRSPVEQSAAAVTTGVPFFREIVLAFLLAGMAALVWYAVRHWRETVRFLAALAALVVLGLAITSLLPSGALPSVTPVEPLPGGGAGGQSSGADTTDTDQPVPPLAAVLVVAALGIAGLTVVLSRRSDADDEGGDESTAAASDAAAVGRAAGRAADRLEDAESPEAVDSEIYRAWEEMTGLLDVAAPETTTPGEFAAAATAAGLEPDDVSELTTLFEAVRYGARTPSEADERRAVALLERIEDEYARDAREDA